MRKKSYIWPLLASLCLLLSACSKDNPIDYLGFISPNGETVDTRFAQSQEYNKQRPALQLDMQSDNYVIYVCSDSHITRSRHRNLDTFIADYQAETRPKIAIHLGDVIDAQDNYPCADSILHYPGQTIADTLFVTPGNHDIYFRQWPIYRSYFKTSAYWFTTSNGDHILDLFICLDSAEGALGPAQTQWLTDLLAQQSQLGYRHIIVFTHTHLWRLDNSQELTSNMALEETYALSDLLGRYGVSELWAGHQHARQALSFKGVQYFVLDATKDTESGASYMTVLMDDAITHTFHPYQ